MPAPGLPAVRDGVRRLASAAIGLVYPPTCVACGGATGQPHALCAACWRGLRLIERPYCERLGTPFALDLGIGSLLSPGAIAEPPVFGRARAVAIYDGTARDLVHRLKYGDRLDLARTMGRMMASAGREVLDEAELILPVPLHGLRLWRRRFNQSALLARAIGEIAGKPCELHALVRVKATRPQVGLTRAQRAANLQGAFRVADRARLRIAGRRLLLIDDVSTTGATGNAAARVLLRAGAAGVDLLTFATVARDGL
ncbi:competence protein F [Methylorubrum populi BJ001]|jgi:ComF family protein|uniref:Competence protein F n=1 Tax=Methylorubrum populi (strain ATCC BAA-705 / NCIMB 13946 / BJ001) TaxID=441620 RepID=B1ZI75_METPB|nr:ComF family protein [Methylorubrum populi]ACB78561.1 competence protein F [Methylorubrum populi BJ001]OAH35084.1 competence protein ComF [Methylorubrum populi]PZP69861.1 MAG: ComF family protein [Methylorubrum populi]